MGARIRQYSRFGTIGDRRCAEAVLLPRTQIRICVVGGHFWAGVWGSDRAVNHEAKFLTDKNLRLRLPPLLRTRIRICVRSRHRCRFVSAVAGSRPPPRPGGRPAAMLRPIVCNNFDARRRPAAARGSLRPGIAPGPRVLLGCVQHLLCLGAPHIKDVAHNRRKRGENRGREERRWCVYPQSRFCGAARGCRPERDGPTAAGRPGSRDTNQDLGSRRTQMRIWVRG